MSVKVKVRLKPHHVIALFHERIMYEITHSVRDPHEQEDLYSDLILKISEHLWDKKPTICRHLGREIPIDPSHVICFLRHRVIDAARRRRRRFTLALDSDDTMTHPVTRPEQDKVDGQDEVQRLLRVLRDNLTEREFEIVMSKAYPPNPVLCLAEHDRAEAEDLDIPGSRRKIAFVADRHVAEHLKVSPATVSRALTKARTVLLKVAQ